MDDFRPARVTAIFNNGVAIDPLFTLDGLLGAAIIRSPALRRESKRRRTWRRVAGEHGLLEAPRYFKDRGWRIPAFTHHLPLAVYGHGYGHGLWVYRASYGEPEEPWEWDTQHWARRMNARQVLQYVQNPPKRIQTGKAGFRTYYEALPLFVSRSITWCVAGQLAEIERVLAEVTHIGKKRSQGYGEIREWRIEPEKEDQSVWRGNDLRRPIPGELLERMGIGGRFDWGYYAYRPPYHDSRNLRKCALFGEREEVCGEALVNRAFGSG